MTLVPTSYDVPTGLETDRFRLRPLRTSDALTHYDALMTNVSHLQGAYFRTPDWPAHDLSYSDNHVHVAWHDKERDLKKSFAFVVMSTNGSGYLGNVYVDPCDKSGIDAAVTMWVRESELATGLDAALYDDVRAWIAADWPFQTVAYPERDYTLDEWNELPTKAGPFVPPDAVIPEEFDSDRFRLESLSTAHTARDYDAVMSSVDHLRDCYWNALGWPTNELSFHQDFIDLSWHTNERALRRSFAFAVLTVDSSVQTGCLYIDPCLNPRIDATATMWVRESELATGLDAALYDDVRAWIAADWPFQTVAYPEREYTFDEWSAIVDQR